MIKSNTPPRAITRKYIAAFVRVLILAAFLVAAVQSPVAEASRELVFVNNTGAAISSIYLNGHSVGGLSNRSSRSVKLGSGSIFDIKIVLSNGNDWHWNNVDLHQIWRITFIRNGSKIRAQWN